MLHLMHIEFDPTDVAHPAAGFRAIAEWLDNRIRNDARLDAAERAAPRTVNLLANLVAHDEPPMTINADAVRKFAEIVSRATDGETHETAQAANAIAEEILKLADRHDPVHLTLV
jgi:hypothetical protein